jgi:hypothetical protein
LSVINPDQTINFQKKEKYAMAIHKPVVIPKIILEEFMKERRVVLPDETRGLWPLSIELIKNEAFMKRLAADKEFQDNFEVAIITKGR